MKKRPLLCWMAMFGAGLICEKYIEGTVLITVLLFLCGILCNFCERFEKRQRISLFVMLFCCGAGFFFMKADCGIKEEKIGEFVGTFTEVQGVVCERPIRQEGRIQYTIKNVCIEGKRVPVKLLIRCTEEYDFGDEVIFGGILELPKGMRNRGGFDYRTYLKTKNIWGMLKAEKAEKVAEHRIFFLERFGYWVREKCEEFVFNSMPVKEGGVLQALWVGEDEFLEDELSEDYKEAGMVHLLVVSGSHVAFFILLFTYILSVFEPDKRGMPFFLIAVIILYVFITGSSVSVVRAGIGAIFLLLSKFLGRKSDSLTSLFLVAFLILLCNPMAIYSLSFQLSFAGVLGILIAFPKLKCYLGGLPRKIGECLAVTMAAQIFVTPILVCQFHTLSLSGLFSNLFAVPLSGIIMMLGFAAFFIWFFLPPLGLLLNKITYCLILLMNGIAEFFAGLDFLSYTVVTPKLSFVMLYYLWMLCLFGFWRIRKRFLGMITGAVLLIELFLGWIPSGLEINFIDVGHGDSIFMVLPDKRSVLIDTGGGYWIGEKEYNAGRDTVAPYLLSRGYRHVDMMVITHFDEDHVGGLAEILEVIDTDVVAVSVHAKEKERYSEIAMLAKKHGFVVKELAAGSAFSLGDVRFDVLSPFREVKAESENNDSVCLMCEYEGVKMLFTGDLEATGEDVLLQRGVSVDADILKVGHHGSVTSCSEEFVKAVTPRVSVISVGTRFKSLPGKSVLKRLEEVGSRVYRTDLQGEVSIRVRKGSISVDTCVNMD